MIGRRRALRPGIAILGVAACALVASGTGPPSPGGALARAAPSAQDDAAERGRALFIQHCTICHTAAGVPGGVLIGPDLTDYGSQPLIAGAVANTPENLERWILNPQALVRDATMPSLGLTPAQARDLAAFLLGNRAPAPEDVVDTPAE